MINSTKKCIAWFYWCPENVQKIDQLMLKIITFLHWIHSSLLQLYMYFWISINAPWSIDNPQRCPWNFNDFSLTLFIVITCTQNVLFQHVQGLYPYLTTVLQIETLFAGPAKCRWVVWQRGAIGRPWCRMARLFQLRGLCVPPLWRDVRFTPQVRHVPRKLWWYNPC